jgi:hypothetical protein
VIGMYVFAIVILLGLLVAKFVDLVRGFVDFPRPIRLLLAFLAGMGLTWAADYSMFQAWSIELRELWMGPVATGVVIGALAALWHEVLDMAASQARRVQDEATEIETRMPRVA